MSLGGKPPALSSDTESYQRLQKEYSRLQLLYDISRQLSGPLNLPQVLQQVLHNTTATTGATRGSILLFDEHGEIEHHLFTDQLRQATPSPFTSRVLKQGLASWVLRHNEGALVHDTEHDERWIDFPGNFIDVRSAVSVPLLRGRLVHGTLTLVHPEPEFFDADDLELLSAIALHASLAIENARLMAGINDERRKFESAVNAMEEGLLVVDQHGRMRHINPQTLAFFNIAPPVPSTLAELSPQLDAIWQQAQAAGDNLRTELALVGPPRLELTVYVTYMSVLTDQQDWWTILLHDVTNLKEYDRLKTRFVATASHELRTPLANIKLYAMLAERGKAQHRAQYLQTINTEAARLESLVEDLLTLSRLDSGILPMNRQEIHPVHVLPELVQTYAAFAAERALDLHVQVSDDLPSVWIDKDWLTRIVVNLLSNAIKYTPAGGTITLQAHAALAHEQPGVAIEVIDTGDGIKAEDLPHLFNRFYRGSDSRAGGSGLGLAIVHELITLSQGTVSVSTALGAGSHFSVWLPAYTAPQIDITPQRSADGAR